MKDCMNAYLEGLNTDGLISDYEFISQIIEEKMPLDIDVQILA
ncbi:hypothetical protein ACFLSA_02035 [Bacteroidota bacterium]